MDGSRPPPAGSPAYERHLASARPDLSAFIRGYTYVSVSTPVHITRLVPARADLFLQIIITGSHTVTSLHTGDQFPAPRATLVGPYSHPIIEMGFSGRLELLLVQLQPTALQAFAGSQKPPLLDTHADAELTLAMDVRQVIADFKEAELDAQRVEAADRFAAALFSLAPQPDAIGYAARRLRDQPSGLSMETLARISGLSRRQFQRRFASQVGIAPKAYARLCRMSAVIAARETQPDRTWADLAAEFGYADQAHLSREFREMTQQTPRRFERYS